MRGTEEVALYAITLRESARNHHTSRESLLDDFACDSEDTSFALMLAHEHFTELDWQLVDLLINHPQEISEIARLLYGEHEQTVEAEALLHAVLPNGKRSGAMWAEPIRARWKQVRASMRAYEGEWITMNLRDVRQIAKDTFIKATGCTEDEWWEHFGMPAVDVELGRVPQITLSARRSKLMNFVGHKRED